MIKASSRISGVEHAWRSGQWTQDLPDTAWQASESAPSVRSLYLAFKIQHAVSGLDSSHLERLGHYLDELNGSWQPLSVRLLCAQLQLGQMDQARNTVVRHMAGHINFLRSNTLARFPLALAFFEQEQPERLSRKLTSLARQASLLIANSQPVNATLLRSMISDNDEEKAPAVAIVGNGPTLLDGSFGQAIDEHDLIIRFNRPNLNSAYRHHTGSRTDLWVISPGLDYKQSQSPISAMAISGINPLSGESRYWRSLPADPSMPVAHFRQQHWYSLVSKLQAPPSAGLLTLASLENENECLDISLFGFTESADSSIAALGSHYGDNQQASTRHNWNGEAQLVSEWVDRNCQ